MSDVNAGSNSRKSYPPPLSRWAMAVCILLAAYVASYVIWVPIARSYSRNSLGLSHDFLFADPSTPVGADIHVFCPYFYMPLIYLDQKLTDGLPPSQFIPDMHI
jgi:hypothetical protein